MSITPGAADPELDLVQRELAATRIQSSFRGGQARRHARDRREAQAKAEQLRAMELRREERRRRRELRIRSITLVQAIVRGWRVRSGARQRPSRAAIAGR